MALSPVTLPAEALYLLGHRVGRVEPAEARIVAAGLLGERLDAPARGVLEQGGVVLGLHGFNASPKSWSAIGRTLEADGATFYAPELYHRNTRATGRTVDQLVDYLREEVVPRHPGQPIHVVGHSRGGMIGGELVRRQLAGERSVRALPPLESFARIGSPEFLVVNDESLNRLWRGYFSLGGPTSGGIAETFKGPVTDAITSARIARHRPSMSIASAGSDGMTTHEQARMAGARNVVVGTLAEHPEHIELLTDARVYGALRSHLHDAMRGVTRLGETQEWLP